MEAGEREEERESEREKAEYISCARPTAVDSNTGITHVVYVFSTCI